MDATTAAVPSADPSPGRRVLMAVAALFGGIVSAAFIGSAAVALGGWELGVAASIGSDFGRTARQLAEGIDLDDHRIPLAVGVMLNVPLWACFVGVPLWARGEGLDWRRHLGWSMKLIDVPIGLAIGVVSQLLVLPVLYIPILRWVDGDDLEAPARDLIATAGTSLDVVALIVLTVIGAPIAEEILFRGMLHRGIADLEADRGRLGVAMAVVASSAIFAASHLQLLQFPGLFAIGAIAAMGLSLTGRLGTSIWIHVGFNATTVVVLLSEIY